MVELIEDQWRIAHRINDLLKTQGAIPVFIGYFAKRAITGAISGVTKDVDSFVFDAESGITKGPVEQLNLAEFLVEEFRKQSVNARVRQEQYAVHLIVRTSSGDVTVEFLYPAEGIQPDSDHLKRSFIFGGLHFISPEDWIAMKLEAIRDRTENDPEAIKHKNDLLELAEFYRTSINKLDQRIIYSEIQKREKRKQRDMRSFFHQFFDETILLRTNEVNKDSDRQKAHPPTVSSIRQSKDPICDRCGKSLNNPTYHRWYTLAGQKTFYCIKEIK